MTTAETESLASGPVLSADYSPEDNKLRLRASRRLDRDLYDRVKAAGFSWAPKQELFVAPAWSPEREDLLVELCGEIGDEDTSLVDRAEERADRFDGYREKRADEAHAAKDAVEKISEGIPLGSPILVGHHSEKRARKDAQRIESGMRKAVKLWATSEYWTRRAAGALRHAKYKELPGVRHRRIKGLEADKRKHEKAIAESSGFLKAWRAPDLSLARATEIANWDHQSVQEEGKSYPTTLWSMLNEGKITAELAAQHAIVSHEKRVSRDQRWVEHIDNRLAYERAMLGEQGGIPAEQWAIEPGGRALVGYDRVVMNSPFANGADVAHVTHAFSFLRPGGRLVAIMSAAVKFRSDRKTKAFRELVEAHGGEIEDLPEGSFRASGTDVRTVLVTIDRGPTTLDAR